MATKTDVEANGCTLQWKIVNISHCWLKTGEVIQSPSFVAHSLEGTKWFLKLYPMGRNDKKYFSIDLLRDAGCTGPTEIVVKSNLAFLHSDGSQLLEQFSNGLYRRGDSQYKMTTERRKVFVTDREMFLPDDTLTVQCTIWKEAEETVKPKSLFARTVWNVKCRSFIWKIENFSTFNPSVRNKFKDELLELEFLIKEGLDSEKGLVIEGIFFHESIKYFSFKIAVINWEGKEECYGSQEYFEADVRKGISSTRLSTRMLNENKSRYLPNDILSLSCECVYSTGTVSDQFCSSVIICPKVTDVPSKKRNGCCIEKEQHSPALANDLKSIYNDGLFSDVELRTSSKTFPAHKLLLTARSPVFRRMFSNDMKENNSGEVNITDLEDDTVRRMLLYLYTDSLEDMQLEKACQLYVAADKYEISSLRSRCSSFMKDNMCTAKACDVLLLADLHRDEDLKNAVQDFILGNDKEVFGSPEWRLLMESNPKLAAEVMYLKVFPG